MTAAAFELVRRGQTDHPLISKSLRAAAVNKAYGTNIAPWEIDSLPYEWQDAAEIIAKLPEMQHAERQVQAAMQKIRARHVAAPKRWK